MNRSVIAAFILITSIQTVFADVNRYMVFFTDKNDSEFSIEMPEMFLSEKSIQRREKQGISITESDLPVNRSYILGLKEAGADVYFTSKWMNAALVQMDADLVDNIESLSFVATVEYIAPGSKLTREKVSIDKPEDFFPATPGSATSELQLGMMNVDDMHESDYRGEGITIAVFDAGFTGVNLYEPFASIHNENRLLTYRDFVYNSGNPYQYSDHGTAVLSCIGADHPDIKGTAYKASIILAVTEDVRSEFRIEEYNWLIAAEFADSAGADIIHSSLGYSVFGKEPSFDYEYDDMDGKTAIVSQAANLASERGILVVTSAGNEGNSSWRYITAPADGVNTLSVGAIRSDYTKSSFSSVGPTADGRIKPDVVSLGSGTTIVTGSGRITRSNGTSYAAPLVAGLAAGLWQANPDWNYREVINAIKYTASRAMSPDSLYGYGVPNYLEAVKGSILSVDKIVYEGITVFPNPFRDNKIFIDLAQLELDIELNVELYDVKGSLLSQRMFKNKGGIISMEVNNVESGVYFLKINSEDFSKTVKLIKN